MHTKVPLWLAINLKQRHKCRIEPPAWLSVGEQGYATSSIQWFMATTDELAEKVIAEKASTPFTKMASPHYMELASLLLNKYA
jgi:GINS complex subunit 2